MKFWLPVEDLEATGDLSNSEKRVVKRGLGTIVEIELDKYSVLTI